MSSLGLPNVSHVIGVPGVPRPSQFFVALPCIMLNANQRTKYGGGLGTRLQHLIMKLHHCHYTCSLPPLYPALQSMSQRVQCVKSLPTSLCTSYTSVARVICHFTRAFHECVNSKSHAYSWWEETWERDYVDHPKLHVAVPGTIVCFDSVTTFEVL